MPNPRIPEGSAAAGEFDSDDGDDDFRRNRNYTPASSSVDNLEYKDLSRNFSSVRAMVVDGQQDEIHHQSEHRNDREHQQQQYYQHRQYQGHSRGHSHDGRYYGYNNNNVGGSGHPGGAENLHQGVAAALGLHDQHLGTAARLNETSKYSVMHPPTMSDATMRADSSHQPVYRSTGMIRGPRTPSSLGGDGGDSIPPFPPRPMTTTTMPENNTAATSHGSAATFASISHVSSVHALPINGASTASTYRMPSFAGEPPMTQAVPVPAGDQPEDCTTGVLYHKPQPLGNHVISHLRELGYSGGLIQTLNELKARFPIRFWLVDNSGSMLSQGGCEVRGAASEKPYVADCTRWVELKGTLQWHATLAGILENHTVFRLLNAPDQLPGMREFALADPSSDLLVEESVKRANEIIEKVGPRGFTPLTMHLERVLDSVQSIQHTLCDRGQQAVVVIATDGLPTDGTGEYTTESREKFETTLKLLQPLPVWLVFRLCTDDPDVMAYYNGLDRKLEWNIEVIDDYLHEAKQVHRNNPWLNYAMPLHRCREMGFHPRVVDILDERMLDKDELLKFLKILFGCAIWNNAPDIHTDWRQFVAYLQSILDSEQTHYNPLTRRKAPWIDMRQLNRSYTGRFSFLRRNTNH